MEGGGYAIQISGNINTRGNVMGREERTGCSGLSLSSSTCIHAAGLGDDTEGL